MDTSNIDMVGDYTVRVTYMTPAAESIDTDTGWEFIVSIKSPCLDAALTIDPTIVPSTFQYIASQPVDV